MCIRDRYQMCLITRKCLGTNKTTFQSILGVSITEVYILHGDGRKYDPLIWRITG